MHTAKVNAHCAAAPHKYPRGYTRPGPMLRNAPPAPTEAPRSNVDASIAFSAGGHAHAPRMGHWGMVTPAPPPSRLRQGGTKRGRQGMPCCPPHPTPRRLCEPAQPVLRFLGDGATEGPPSVTVDGLKPGLAVICPDGQSGGDVSSESGAQSYQTQWGGGGGAATPMAVRWRVHPPGPHERGSVPRQTGLPHSLGRRQG